MSAATGTPILARARLRRNQSADALARVLLPEEEGARLGAAHSLVWALFADNPDRRRDFLWREMRSGEFLILSARPPVDCHNLFDLEMKPFAPSLSAGQRLGFDLRANPTVSVAEKNGKRGKRNDIVMHALHPIEKSARADRRDQAMREAGATWLSHKGEISGFAIDRDQLHIDGYERVRIPREIAFPERREKAGRRASPIVFSKLTLQGVLTVRDPARFLAGLVQGFGAAKAFGCGLMLIRRAA